MNSTHARRLAAAGLAAASLAVVVPVTTAQAQAGAKAASAAADAYALDIDVKLLDGNVPIDEGPFGRATQEFPPLAAAPAEGDELKAGPIPAGGELVNKAGVMTSLASATGEPQAVASAQSLDVELLATANAAPRISADVILAQSQTDCVEAPSGDVTFVGLAINGTPVPDQSPAPNTVVASAIFDALGIRVVLNEQHPTADGRGFVVNAIHIYNVEPAPLSPLFDGDIIVSHAMTTVNCPNGAPSTGGTSPVFIVKNADKAKAAPGDTVTYTATVQNKADKACVVNQFIDHAPAPFELVSTAGDFGTVAETVARPGGGQDIVIKPEGLTIPAGGAATQTFVLKVKDDAAPGTYFNNVEILCANLGNFVKGLDAPVEVTGDTPPPVDPPDCSDKVDNDGDGKIDFPNDPGCDSPEDDDERDRPAPLPRTGSDRGLQVLAGLGLLTAALLLRRRAATL